MSDPRDGSDPQISHMQQQQPTTNLGLITYMIAEQERRFKILLMNSLPRKTTLETLDNIMQHHNKMMMDLLATIKEMVEDPIDGTQGSLNA